MAADPLFGGTNGVPELDIGQTGSARNQGGTHKSPVTVILGPPEVTETKVELVQQSVNFVDSQGFSGQAITWRTTLRAASEVEFNRVLGELNAYRTGINHVTNAAVNPALMRATKMVAHAQTWPRVQLRGLVTRQRRSVTPQGWYVQPMELVFEVLGHG